MTEGADGLRTSDFSYHLPEGRIARYPAARRDESRLLVVPRPGGALEDRHFRDLPDLLRPGDALVVNDSRVFPARLLGAKPTGASAEVLLLRPLAAAEAGELAGPVAGEERLWEALVRPGGKLKPGRVVEVAEGFRVRILDSTPDGGRIVRLEGGDSAWEMIERHGHVPLPPYLEREDEPLDEERYQTVYARRPGSVAAPTAGLHFTPELLEEIEGMEVAVLPITLHVGIGTFRPVDAERPEEHRLHAERYRLPEESARRLASTRREGGRIWAVGTTVARTLETVAGPAGEVAAASGWTELFIHPPYEFRAVDALVTNFHLPRSSLLMLVAAFAGHERTMEAYRHAVEAGYRFYSYGDAMAVTP